MTIRRASAGASAPAPVPTIGELQRTGGGWVWAYCDGCSYCAPMALAAAAIVYGGDASSDTIREGALCSACSHEGVSFVLRAGT